MGIVKSNQTIIVSNAEELADELTNVGPGATIVLEDGLYDYAGTYLIADKHGSDGAMIRIMARNKGKAILTGESNIHIAHSSHVQLWGLTFRTERCAVVTLDSANHVKLTRNKFELVQSGENHSWLVVVGTGSGWNRIERNEFGPKSDPGPIMIFDGDGRSISQNDVIEYNYFHDVGPRIENGLEVIRLGLSGLALSHGYITIQHNLFENCDGEPEIISVKSSFNTVRHNTFLNSAGQVTARHGHSNRFYGNCFIGDGVKEEMGGFRIYGNDHQLFDNYMENLTIDPLLIDGGNYDGGTEGYPLNPTIEELRKHWRVYRATVVNNRLVNCKVGITVGKRVPFEPIQCIVANNRLYQSDGEAVHEYHPSQTTYVGNLRVDPTTESAKRPKVLTPSDVGPNSI